MTVGLRQLGADDADDNLYDPHSFSDIYSSSSYTTTVDNHHHHHPSSSSLKGSPSPTNTTTRRTIDSAASKKIPRRAIDLFAGLKLKGKSSSNTKKRRRRSIAAAPMTIAIGGVGKEGRKSGGNFSSSSELVKKSE